MEELKKYLEKIAKQEISPDKEGFEIHDWYAGNINDAYYAGSEHGEVTLARTLLESFFKQ